MANTDNAFGMKPIRYLSSGHPYSGATTMYRKEASNIVGIGDPVVLTGSAESTTGIPLVDLAAAASGTITGVVVGIKPLITDLNKQYLAAADTGYVFVADSPDLVFEIQEDSITDTLAVGDVGEFADFIITAAASTSTGRSNVELSSTTRAGGSGTDGDQLRIMGLVQREDNAIGANAKWEVTINEHTFKSVQTPI